MARVVCLGASLQDIFLVDNDDFLSKKVDGVPIFQKLEIGTKVDIDEIFFATGGGATNAAVTLARAGHEVFVLSNVGADPAGEAVLRELETENIKTNFIEKSPEKTGVSVVLLDTNSGERTILTHRGASKYFDNLRAELLEEIRPEWIYCTTLQGDFATLEKFFRRADELGIKIMFNPGKKELENPEKTLSLLGKVKILAINETEMKQLIGSAKTADVLTKFEKCATIVIMTTGKSGGVFFNGRDAYEFGVYEDVVVVDTTGAGDALGSGFLAAILNGAEMEEAITYAAANASFVVAKLGAKSGIIRRETVLHKLNLRKI